MKRVAFLLSIGLSLLSCSKENPSITAGDINLSVKAELPEMPLIENNDAVTKCTKASTQYTVRIKWVAGDKLSVVNLTTGKILGGILSAESSGTQTTFSGTLTGTIAKGDVLAYLYPAQNNPSEEEFSGITIDMSSQSGTMAGVPLCVYCTETVEDTSFENISLKFSFFMSYVTISLSDLPASAKISSLSLTNVTNSFGLSINSSKSGFDVTPHTGNVELKPGVSASAAGVKTVYAAIPGSASATRLAVLETDMTSFSTSFTSAKLNNGYAYNTNVSGFLVDNFVIADQKLREYCLEHFDLNKDGKLSMVEIAGVSHFPDQSQYPIPSDISQFKELEYFYGLSELPSFENQRKLETIAIPQQITSIPDGMFNGCVTLTKIILKPTIPPTLGENVFNGLPDKFVLVVPDNSISDYRDADGWRDYFNNFWTERGQDGSKVNIDTEDENSMGNDRIDIKQ